MSPKSNFLPGPCLLGDWCSIKNPNTSPRARNSLILSICPGHMKSCPFRQNLFILLFPLPQKCIWKESLVNFFFFLPTFWLILCLHQHQPFLSLNEKFCPSISLAETIPIWCILTEAQEGQPQDPSSLPLWDLDQLAQTAVPLSSSINWDHESQALNSHRKQGRERGAPFGPQNRSLSAEMWAQHTGKWAALAAPNPRSPLRLTLHLKKLSQAAAIPTCPWAASAWARSPAVTV